jgi:hypothetical protein
MWHSYTPQGAKAQMQDHKDKHAITFTPISLTGDAPWISGTFKSICLNHVAVPTRERHDHGVISIPYKSTPRGRRSQPWFELTTFCTAGEHSSKELLQQLLLLLFITPTIYYFVAVDPNDYIDIKRKESRQLLFQPIALLLGLLPINLPR